METIESDQMCLLLHLLPPQHSSLARHRVLVFWRSQRMHMNVELRRRRMRCKEMYVVFSRGYRLVIETQVKCVRLTIKDQIKRIDFTAPPFEHSDWMEGATLRASRTM